MLILKVNQELIERCGDYGLAIILQIIQKVMTWIQIIVPIVLIISIIMIIIKMMTNPDEKKNTKALFNCVAAGVITILLPFIVNLVMGFLNDSFSVTACWNVARKKENLINWNEPTNNVATTSKQKEKIK